MAIDSVPVFEQLRQLLSGHRFEAAFKLRCEPLEHPLGLVAPGTQSRRRRGQGLPIQLKHFAQYMYAGRQAGNALQVVQAHNNQTAALKSLPSSRSTFTQASATFCQSTPDSAWILFNLSTSICASEKAAPSRGLAPAGCVKLIANEPTSQSAQLIRYSLLQ